MNVRNLNVILLALFVFSSCSQGQSQGKENSEEGKVILQGSIQNPASGHVVLEEVQDNKVVPIDTLVLDQENTFNKSITVKEPGFYRLNLYGKQYVTLVLNDEDVQVEADMKSQEPATVKGSQDTDYLEQINALLRQNQQEVALLEKEYVEARDTKNNVRMKELEADYMEMEKQKREQVKQVLRGMESSISQVYGVNYLDKEADFPFLDSLATRLKGDLPDSKYVKDFAQGVDNMRATVEGNVAPEISLPNPAGETQSLSDLRGNYVLIDFWAAWCGPCRKENPNVVAMYNKYHDKGFEVFGVSLDRNRDDWVKAIEKDGLVWTQVSDLNYFNSEAAKTYSVNAIPATVLLDREGRIIARNLRGPALEQKLEELLGN